ncbi:hypothetical protein [Desulfobulbus oralis]|uniref:hypothetical protein n=1 Tax=Desulfobulbus oralis TaxID=1986146 RepID=UPI0011B03881|nr:hypothetical protein [Desulfobulbus oralis]
MLPKRTKITHLSNGELFILDFLALEGRSNFKNLCEENYSIHMNVEYSHDFNDRELLRVLNTLKYEQYITFNNNYYQITKKGGGIWAIERTPIWNRYCIDSSYEDSTNIIIDFLCTDKNIGYKFAKTSIESNLYHTLSDNLVLNEIYPGSLLYWKSFPKEYTWRDICHVNEVQEEVDWDTYHRNREWWRTLDELQLFLK